MAVPWFPKQTSTTIAAANAASQQAALDEIAQSTDAAEQILLAPSVLPVGGATEATQQLNQQALGTEGGGVIVPPPGGGTGILGWIRNLFEFFQSILSIVGAQRAIKVDVIQTVGGGGGAGDASAANQVIQITTLNAIIAKLIAAPSTEAKQDAAIALLTTINAALGAPLAVALPTGASTEAKQDAIITLLGTLSTTLSGTLTVGLPVGASTSALQSTIVTALGTLGTQTTLAAILAKLIAAPATETTLSNILTALGTPALPGGSATAANQSTEITVLGAILTALSSVTVTGPLTDSQLRATAVAISAATLPLPAGASTSAFQSTGNTTLAAIQAALASVAVTGPLTDTQLRAVAVAISAASLPLPAGAATSALQGTGNTSLASLDTKMPALGQALAAASTPVVLTAIQQAALTPPAAIIGFALNATLTGGTQLSRITDGTNNAGVSSSNIAGDETLLDRLKVNSALRLLDTAQPVNARLVAALGDQTSGLWVNTKSITPPALAKGTQAATGFSVQNLRDAGRTTINYYTNGAAAAGATTVETAITLTESRGTTATTTAVSFTPTSGKTLRITSITLRCTGATTATFQTTVFSLRVNTAGAVVTTTTPILQRWSLLTPATASAIDRLVLEFPEGIDIFGNGTIQWGITVQSTYVTNAPNYHLNLTGYEF